MILIIKSDIGRKEINAIGDFETASTLYRDFVERNNLGASEVDFGKVYDGAHRARKLIATISYNGKIEKSAQAAR